MTTVNKSWPTRIGLNFRNKNGFVVLDQIRTVDKERLVKKLGTINAKTREDIHKVILEMFAE